MNEIILPPSPNWYLSNILACSFDGTVAWGARNVIVVVKCNEKGKPLQYSIIKQVHKDKVTCLAFAPKCEEGNSNLLASTGDDGIIKIWNIETLSMNNSYSLGNGIQATGIDWSYKDTFTVYSISSNGCVLSWNAHFDTVSSINLGRVMPTCISSCPHDSKLVAVGSKTGLIYIVNFQGKGTIVYKLRGHDNEIVSLSWCPSEKNVISGNFNRDLLLSSGGKDRSIYIWRAGGDGRYEMSFPVPFGPLDSHQHRSKLNASVGNWIAIRWVEPKLLLTSSSWGELISWDLSTITKDKPICKLIHAYHSRGLFCIAHVPNVEENVAEDWRIKRRLTVWTLAQDRKVICCGIQDNNVERECNIFTQGGYIYCIAACPLDTSHIAFGSGDAMLRLWNLSEAHSTSFDITFLWQKIKGKIRTISWHPEKENLLAFATEEGRVGIFNTNSNKLPTLYRQYHRKIVYSIGWGPSPQSKQYVLYSCAEGELVFYNLETPKQEPTSVLKKECTEFSWKPDFSCLSVGFENGSISFLNRKFEICGHAKFSSVQVYCLVWHPESTATDSKYSPLKNYLAASFASNKIMILDLSNFMNHLTELENSVKVDNEKERCDPYKVHEIVATLTGHVEQVVCLAWSPYISGHLISGSYDSTVQVWNVETQELIATYMGHCGPVLCCMWSPLDPDFIITGSADNTVRIWKVACNSAILPEENAHQKSSKKSRKKQNKTNKIANVTEQNSITDLAESVSQCSISDTSQIVQKSKTVSTKELKNKKLERTPYFAKSSKTMTDKTLLLTSLLNVVRHAKDENSSLDQNEQNSSYHMMPLLFSTKEDFTSLLTNEKCAHIAANRHNIATEMDLWCDNLKQNLEEAAKQKRLNDFLISLSANLSMKTWKEMCELYAYQLVNEGNPYKAVSYLLCIHKTYKAIEVFQDANLYKDAYALARCKLELDDPVLETVLQNWAKYCAHIGNLEEAACIYAKLGNFSETVKYLARRKDTTTLITAAEIALLCDDDTLSKSLSDQALITALTNSEYNLARSIITKFPYLKYQDVYLLTLEELKNVMKKDVDINMFETWLDGKSNYGLLQNLQTICGDCNSYYSELCQNTFHSTLDNEQMLWLTVSNEIAKAVASVEKEQQLKHVVAALSTIAQFETMHRKNLGNQCNFLIEVIIKLDAKSPTDEGSIYAKTNYPVSVSLRAYLCHAYLNWLVDNVHEPMVINKIQVHINLIKNLLEDVLNKAAVQHSLITSEITKLENQITSTLCKTLEESKNEPHTESLIQELNTLKTQKKQFLNDLVSLPNVVMVYSKANELASKLLDETMKAEFSKIVSETWTNATL